MGIIDLFSGVGGLGLGFKLAGFEIDVAVELNPKRSLVYKRNVKPTLMINSDVRKVDFTQFRNVDGVIAGPLASRIATLRRKAVKESITRSLAWILRGLGLLSRLSQGSLLLRKFLHGSLMALLMN